MFTPCLKTTTLENMLFVRVDGSAKGRTVSAKKGKDDVTNPTPPAEKDAEAAIAKGKEFMHQLVHLGKVTGQVVGCRSRYRRPYLKIK